MKNFFIIQALGLLFSTQFLHGEYIPFNQNTSFHLPITNAERKLEYIIRLGTDDSTDARKQYLGMANYIVKFPHKNKDLPLEFTDIFTKEYIYAWSNYLYNNTDYPENCWEDMCGTDCNQIIWAQDNSETFLYRTLAEGENYAVIQVFQQWYTNKEYPSEEKANLTYRLLKKNNEWLIHGRRTYHAPGGFSIGEIPPYDYINFPH